jgi:hypothetical protein
MVQAWKVFPIAESPWTANTHDVLRAGDPLHWIYWYLRDGAMGDERFYPRRNVLLALLETLPRKYEKFEVAVAPPPLDQVPVESFLGWSSMV